MGLVMKVNKAQRRRDATVAWWDRCPWPCCVLAVDPGKAAGYSLAGDGGTSAHRIVMAGEVDTDTIEVENVVTNAIRYSVRRKLPLVLATEDWGSGGPLGMQQWLSLGAQRGAWERAFRIQSRAAFPKKKPTVVRINVSRWRGRVGGLLETRPKTTNEWKEASRSAAIQITGADGGGDNAAEAILIGYYASRSDEVGAALGARELKRHGRTFEPLEDLIHAT